MTNCWSGWIQKKKPQSLKHLIWFYLRKKLWLMNWIITHHLQVTVIGTEQVPIIFDQTIGQRNYQILQWLYKLLQHIIEWKSMPYVSFATTIWNRIDYMIFNSNSLYKSCTILLILDEQCWRNILNCKSLYNFTTLSWIWQHCPKLGQVARLGQTYMQGALKSIGNGQLPTFTEEPACAQYCPNLTFQQVSVWFESCSINGAEDYFQRLIGFAGCAAFGWVLSLMVYG